MWGHHCLCSHANQEQLLSSSQNEKALWRRNHSPTWLRSINLMSGCTCRLFIPVCTEGWLRYAKFTISGRCAYVHLHPDSSLKSPYMELTTPSFTMHNLICISLPCIFPST
uniref:Uncharacterized protein n=1 Tax=Cyprinus carpio TaxID=7962 RepID=A0A8C2ELQ4_CYPCA